MFQSYLLSKKNDISISTTIFKGLAKGDDKPQAVTWGLTGE